MSFRTPIRNLYNFQLYNSGSRVGARDDVYINHTNSQISNHTIESQITNDS